MCCVYSRSADRGVDPSFESDINEGSVIHFLSFFIHSQGVHIMGIYGPPLITHGTRRQLRVNHIGDSGHRGQIE